jgi:hypothetical protein
MHLCCLGQARRGVINKTRFATNVGRESEKERKSIGVVQAKLNFYRCAACANQPEQTTTGPLALSLIRVKLRAEELSRKAAAFIYIVVDFFPSSSVTRCSARRERERARRECASHF